MTAQRDFDTAQRAFDGNPEGLEVQRGPGNRRNGIIANVAQRDFMLPRGTLTKDEDEDIPDSDCPEGL